MVQENSKKQDNLILPNSNFVLVWSIFFSLSIIAYFAIAIFQIGFRLNPTQLLNKTPQIVAIIFFCALDSIIYLNIGIILNGKLVKDRYNNLISYTRSWLFITDCFVFLVLTIRLILGFINNQYFGFALSILDLFIGLKFINVRRYEQILKFYYFNQWSLLIYQFVKHVILLAFLCHIVGCAFFLLDSLLIENQWYQPSQYWLISAQAMPNLYYAPYWQQYVYSFYFSIVTLSTVAYGDITPLNQTQVLFVLCILGILLMFYVYIFTQIYEVVNWFNRKTIRIQQDRYKLAKFLKQFKISANLSGRIVNQFEYRQRNEQKTNKDLFINDISVNLAKNYSSMPYKYNMNKFMPRFVKFSDIDQDIFNQSLTQKFFVPEENFSPVQYWQNEVQKNMYFVGNKTVSRLIYSGTSHLQQLAEKDRWLGINMFMTSQFDKNQKWKVDTPTELTVLNYKTLINYIRSLQKPYQKFLQQCHRSTYFGGSSQDMNKCLICWKGYHNSINCSQYRPQIRQQGRILRKTSRLNQLRKLIKMLQYNSRQKSLRTYKLSVKTMKGRPLIIQTRQNTTQTDFNSAFYRDLLKRRVVQKSQQIVRDWPYYMNNYNIPKYAINLQKQPLIRQFQS